MHLFQQLPIVDKNQLSTLYKAIQLSLPTLLFFGMVALATASPHAYCFEYEEFLNNADTSEPKIEEVFRVVEEMPRFPGCEDNGGSMNEIKQCSQEKLLQFVSNEINYPEAAREKEIEGMTIVSFIVEKDGSISNAEIVRDIGEGFGGEAVRVVERMNELGIKWIPGKQRGRKVRVQFNLPVRFKLEEAKKE